MNKIIKVTLLGSAAALASHAQADNSIALHHLNYEESDGRVDVGDTVLSFEFDAGVDHTFKGSIGYDSISGASPAWQVGTPVLSAEDSQDRSEKLDDASKLTPTTLLAYDPNASNYEVRKVALEDTRKSADITWTSRDSERNELSIGLNYSKESDFLSYGANASYLLYADSRRNRSYSYGISLLKNDIDRYRALYRGVYQDDSTMTSLDVGLSQILSPNSFFTANLYFNIDSGYLSNHYLTVLREIDVNKDGSIQNDEVFLAEDLRPDSRKGGGLTLSYVTSLTNSGAENPVALHSGYRFYRDDWKIQSHTLELEINAELTQQLSALVKFRWYDQSAASFYRGGSNQQARFNYYEYASSDERLGAFDAQTYGVGLSYKLSTDLLLDLQLEHYEQSNGFSALSSMGGLRLKL